MKLDDRMKVFEKANAGSATLMPGLPALARLDGHSFSTWTKDLEKPWDGGFVGLMHRVTQYLVEEFDVTLGYVASDEISLVWKPLDLENSQMQFGGRVQKLCSLLAGHASGFFDDAVRGGWWPEDRLTGKKRKLAVFDCRVWNVPTKQEAVNCFIWRENDTTRNSISMLAQKYFSHNQLHGKNTDQMQEMLHEEHGINWSATPWFLKRGSYFRRVVEQRKFSAAEIKQLPEKHEARTNPDLMVTRASIKQLMDFPRMASIANAVDVVFEGAEPQLKEE